MCWSLGWCTEEVAWRWRTAGGVASGSISDDHVEVNLGGGDWQRHVLHNVAALHLIEGQATWPLVLWRAHRRWVLEMSGGEGREL